MQNNKYAAKSYEQQHLQRVRRFTLIMVDINVVLGDVHRELAKKIDIERFKAPTAYVNQFISYTTIWNLKFVYNFENPEVVMLQLFHLQYVLDAFEDDTFMAERAVLAEQAAKFDEVRPYSDEVIEARRNAFLAFVSDYK